MGNRNKQKKSKETLVKFRKIVKDKQQVIEKLENYNEKLQEWNDLIQEIRDLLKDIGIEFDPEIERKLNEISEIIGKLDSPTDQAFDMLLGELEKGINELTSADAPSKTNSKINKNSNYSTSAMLAGKKIGIVVAIIAIIAIGSIFAVGSFPKDVAVKVLEPEPGPDHSPPSDPVERPKAVPADPDIFRPGPIDDDKIPK